MRPKTNSKIRSFVARVTPPAAFRLDDRWAMDPIRAIFEEADRDHGPIRVSRCFQIGATKTQLRTLLDKGVLLQVDRGILAPAGARRCLQFDIMVGVKRGEAPGRAKGVSAAASGITSCIVHGLLIKPEKPIHILSTRHVAAREGYVFHRTGRLPREEIVVVDRVPVTDPARAFLDLCATHPGLAPFAYGRGFKANLLGPEIVLRRIDRETRQGRGGIAVARALVEGTDLAAIKGASRAEDDVYSWIRDAGLPPPERNALVPSSMDWDWEIDLLYPGPHPIAIEVSPWDTHNQPGTHDKDHLKLNDLVSQGYRYLAVSSPEQRLLFLKALRRALAD